MTRYVVLLRRVDGPVESMALLHHTEAEAMAQAEAWIEHTQGKLQVEVVTVDVPEAGRAVNPTS